MSAVPSIPQAQSASNSEAFHVTDRYRSYVVWLLFVVFLLNFVDRQIMTILIQPIKEEFKFSDTQLGLLGGVAFAVLYSTIGIPIARLSDRKSRVTIIAISLTIWSLFTALTGLARNFTHLFFARVLVGLGEAGCTPPAHSLISDYFTPERRSRALSIYSMGVYMGVFVGFLLGGLIAQRYGWRAAFFVAGVPGLVVAVVLRATLREPPRGFSEPHVQIGEPAGAMETIRSLWALRSFRHTTIAAALHAFVGYGLGQFFPSFLIRSHNMQVGSVAIVLSVATAFGGLAGTLLGGIYADRRAQRTGDRRYLLWVPGYSTFASLPIGLLIYLLPNTQTLWVLILTLPGTAIGAMYLGPTAAITQTIAGVRQRAVASAFSLLVVNLIGLGLGPLLVGRLSDYFKDRFVAGGMTELMASADGLRWSLIVMGMVNLWSALHYMIAARTLNEDLARNSRVSIPAGQRVSMPAE